MNIQTLIAIGGSEWKSGDKHRIYFNDLAGLFGLRISNYGTGNVESAFLNGQKIANGRGAKIDSCLSRGKVWFEVTDGKFYFRIDSCRDFSGEQMGGAIVSEIKRRAAESEAASST